MGSTPESAGAARRGYHHGDLRRALLSAAESVLLERGVAGFTLRECARRAGVSHAAPAHHFRDARGLLTALASIGFERMHATLSHHLDEAQGDLDAEFAATMRGYLEFALSAPELFRLMFRCDLLDMEDEEAGIAPRRTFVLLTNVILRQRGEPELDEASLEPTLKTEAVVQDILIGWCHIHGMAHLLIEGQLGAIVGSDPMAFVERGIVHNAPRLAGVLRAGAASA